jgi:proline iminopeptidase
MDVARKGSGPARVVLIPGGPGLVTAFYSELIDLLSRNHEVITYETRGSYERDMADWPKTLEEYVDELSTVLGQLLASSKPLVLLGHSFGGVVAIEALLSGVQADGVVLSNTFASSEMLLRGTRARIEELPAEFQARRRELDPADQDAVDSLSMEYWVSHHLCRVEPLPASVHEGLNKLNPDLIRHFLGDSIFRGNGALQGWDREADLGRIDIPALVISAEYDYYLLEDVRAMGRNLPKGEVWISSSGSHSTWFEDPSGYIAQIEQFTAELTR